MGSISQEIPINAGPKSESMNPNHVFDFLDFQKFWAFAMQTHIVKNLSLFP